MSTQRRQYQVTSEFTVFRQRDKAPKHLKRDVIVVVHEPLGDPVALEIAAEHFESDRDGFVAHTAPISE